MKGLSQTNAHITRDKELHAECVCLIQAKLQSESPKSSAMQQKSNRSLPPLPGRSDHLRSTQLARADAPSSSPITCLSIGEISNAATPQALSNQWCQPQSCSKANPTCSKHQQASAPSAKLAPRLMRARWTQTPTAQKSRSTTDKKKPLVHPTTKSSNLFKAQLI